MRYESYFILGRFIFLVSCFYYDKLSFLRRALNYKNYNLRNLWLKIREKL